MRVTLQQTFWIVPPARAIWVPPDVHHEDRQPVRPEDRAVLAFSFGPFLGFWLAFEAAAAEAIGARRARR